MLCRRIILSYFFAFFSLCTLLGQGFEVGKAIFGTGNYVEFIPGNLPVVISVPHGGDWKPEEIADRNCSGCVYVKDSFTQELGREVQEEFQERIGCTVHMVINLLHRTKFDANRDRRDAADGDPSVEEAWEEYHAFIDTAKATVIDNFGKGLFLDLHGHGHEIQRIELGYLLSRSDLNREDDDLNEPSFIQKSSIQTLIHENLLGLDHANLVRGHLSFGSLLEEKGYPSVPSFPDPFPMAVDPYFSGGYNTVRHGSMEGGKIDAIQIECNSNIRFSSARRKQFADSLVTVIIDFLQTHYFERDIVSLCKTVSTSSQVEQTFKIFPNPTTGFLTVQIAQAKMNVQLTNVLGKVILESLFDSGSHTWDLSLLSPGLYFLFVYDGAGNRIDKRTILLGQ